MTAVPGFKSALQDYESDKVKDRVSGGERLREIFGNKDNLSAFQESASKNSGEGWIMLFHGLIHAVGIEKKAATKANATAQADKRLNDAVSLVRYIAERSVHYLSRRPLQYIVRHMTSFLVHGQMIFPPTVRDYTKALRTLLSYPPHLENLDEKDWSALMSICWAGALSDRVPREEHWDDEGNDELDETQDTGDGDDEMMGTASMGNGRTKTTPISQATTELLSLIPILLSTPSAPLLPAMPADNDASLVHCVGYRLLQKIIRFLEQRPNETSAHLPVIRSCNLILIELELNAREELLHAGTKLLPYLVGLWSTRNKELREQVLIALRLLLPWLTHCSPEERSAVVQEELQRLADSISKESTSRWGISPLDLQCLRFGTEVEEGHGEASVFRLGHLQAGFDFSHELAFAWTVQQLYANVIIHLYSNSVTVKLESSTLAYPSTSRGTKRRRLEDPLNTLLTGVQLGTPISRLLNLQILIFILNEHSSHIRVPDQGLIRAAALDCMEADDENLQSWSYICLALVQSSFGLAHDSAKVWASATRKIVTPAVSRSAAHCATIILQAGVIGSDVTTRDIGHLLRQIDVQGPSHPYDSVCQFLTAVLEIVRSDVRLYSQNLEEKVISWLQKHDLVDGPRGRSRMDARTGADVLCLLCAIGGLPTSTIPDSSSLSSLPECPIVERLLEEARVQPIRLFVLKGEYPQIDKPKPPIPSTSTTPRTNTLSALSSDVAQNPATVTQSFLSDRLRRISDWLKAQITRDLADWLAQSTTHTSKSSERVRKSLDLAVTALLFQNLLQTNNVSVDNACLSLIRDLLLSFRSELSTAGQITTQLFLWQAFEPLLPPPIPQLKTWPITVRAGVLSGMRSELLPPRPDLEEGDEKRKKRETFLISAWRLPEVSDALREILVVAKKLSDANIGPTSAPPGTLYPTQYATQHAAADDDDFGEIRVAETDAMPISKEALDSQRSANLLLRTIVTFRLIGARYYSRFLGVPKDNQLLNAFLSAEGPRMLQLGRVVCDAVNYQQLRLSNEAMDLIIGVLEEAQSSYAYSRDEGLYLLILSFLHCSASTWVTPELAEDRLVERIMATVQHVVQQMVLHQIKSWRVRLQVLIFLDEYLDYEPTWPLWSQYAVKVAEVGDLNPATAIVCGMKDQDLRVRVRAATSNAGLLALPHLPPCRHDEYYHEELKQHNGRVEAFNLFLTDLLWKVNCCIASGPTRNSALYHLYEIPYVGTDFNVHLRHSLQAIADRLGLPSLKALWEDHVVVITIALLSEKLDTLTLPPDLSGYATTEERAASEIGFLASILLAENGLTYFSRLCEAAGTSLTEQSLRYFYPSVARMLAQIAFDQPSASRQDMKASLLNGMGCIPYGTHIDAEGVLGTAGVNIAVFLFDQLRLEGGIVTAAPQLALMRGSDADLLDLAPKLDDIDDHPVAHQILPEDIVRALAFLELTSTPFDRQAACFNTLLHLFGRIDTIHTVRQQNLLMTQIVFVMATYTETFKNGRNLQLLILESVSLLDQPDINLVAFRLVEWGFSQITASDNDMPRLVDIIARLGRVRRNANEEMGIRLDEWVRNQVEEWSKSTLIMASIHQAAILWPEEMKVQLGPLPDPTFADVADLILTGVPSDSMTICEKMSDMIQIGNVEENRRTFSEQSFWYIKEAVTEGNWTPQGAEAFTKALAAVDGQVDTADKRLSPEDQKSFDHLANMAVKDPVLLVRSLLVQHLMRVVDRGDRPSRVTAYLVVRELRHTIDDLLIRQYLPTLLLNEVSMLRSPLPQELVLTPIYSIDNLSDGIISAVGQPDVWLRELSLRLCDISARDQPFFTRLRSFILSPAAELASIFPLLVQSYMSTCKAKNKTEVAARQAAFQKIVHKTLRNPAASDTVIHAILDTVLHLRSYKPSYRPEALGQNHWFDLDYMLLAESAIRVGSYATALLIVEIEKGGLKDSELDFSDDRLQKVMLAVYSNVNDPDGFYGIQINDIEESLRLQLGHEGEHTQAFDLHSADLESAPPGSSSASDLMACARDLHQGGHNRAAIIITQSINNQTDQSPTPDDLLYETAWRTGNWDLPLPSIGNISSSAGFYSAVRTLHRSRDSEDMQRAVNSAMKADILRLKDLGSERMSEIQQVVDNMLSLREVSLWLGQDVQRALSEGDIASASLLEFGQIKSASRYHLAERLYATRMCILNSVHARETENFLGDLSNPLSDGIRAVQLQAHLNFSGYAREEGHIQASIKAITAARRIEGPKMSPAFGDEYGEVLWMQDKHSLALQLAKQRKEGLDKGSKHTAPGFGVLTGRIANWSYRAKLLPVKDVQDMFHHAYQILSNYQTNEEEIGQLSYDYATFAAEQQAVERNSPELKALLSYRDRRLQEIKDLSVQVETVEKGNRRTSVQKVSKEDTEELKLYAQSQLESDIAAIKDVEGRIDILTKMALKMYAHALRHSDRFDDSVNQLCSIWLGHCDSKMSETPEEALRAETICSFWESSLADIPSRKFIGLGAQLAARLHNSATRTTFNKSLKATVHRISREHPYHILYHIIPLTHNYQAPKSSKKVDEGRAAAAHDILTFLRGDNTAPNARSAVENMSRFATISTNWCLVKAPKKGTLRETLDNPLPVDCPLKQIGRGLPIPIATCIPPINNNMDYSNVPKLARYGSTYQILGGVHRPYKVTAHDDAGNHYDQLFKGEDEVRQDAVMQQVFGMTNKMLKEDRQTRRRNLSFRTYVVIPLAKKTGIMEFVAGGQSIGEWLKPAHFKYRNGLDHQSDDFRRAIHPIQKPPDGTPPDNKRIREHYDRLMKKFRPVMRHFFTERHKDPMAWFAMRLRYSRSVAVTSMVGWMLGIGDRHLSNIMIDGQTGEMVHIDFGIVFEAGAELPIPEKVPFRFTQNVIDGLGITGPEGTFRRCSEQTIRVLRANSELIITILEVFKHDPLYVWEPAHERHIREQGGHGARRIELNQSSAVLEKADRVLGSVRQKLGDSLSPEYTVNMLVQQATDVESLATIFHGWHPWF